MRFQTPRGTEDICPDESFKWHRLESTFRDLAAQYGYAEVRTPTFEETSLFVRSVGDTSDIVTKEMYVFEDKAGRSLTLKPEGTAGVLRAVIQHGLCPQGAIGRFCYVTPVFRYERPQKGRLRESHQLGLELLGSSSPTADAEVIEVTVAFYKAIGLNDLEVSLNSIGGAECRAAFRAAVLVHMGSFLQDQSQEFRARVDKNPLRLLDSKDPEVQAALLGLPTITSFLEPDGRARFEQIQGLLTGRGVKYRLAPEVVRGLDYYTDTVFEVVSSKLGSQNSLCGGGRYDHLVKELEGLDTPSVGVGMGIERALIVLEDSRIKWEAPRPLTFVVCASPEASDECYGLAAEIRKAGYPAITDPDSRSMRAQLRLADRYVARYALILGPDELAAGVVQLRDLDSSSQEAIPRDQILSVLGERA